MEQWEDDHWLRRYDESDPLDAEDFGGIGTGLILLAGSVIITPVMLVLGAIDRIRRR